MRREELCGSRDACDKAMHYRCNTCGHVWKHGYDGRPSWCPQCCEVAKLELLACEDCPVEVLDETIAATPNGHLVHRAASDLAAMKLGFRMELGEIPADEFHALRILDAERAKYECSKTTNR